MNNKNNFSDQVIWKTGASSGIGEELCYQLSALKAKIVLSARNKTALEQVKANCINKGANADNLLVLPLDIIDYPAMPACVNTVIKQFGKIDLLINNAGMSQRSFCVDTDFSVYRQMLEVNVLGQIALTQHVLPIMINQGSGHIAVTASVAGKIGVPLRTGYCAAKHAVMGFFDALRSEVATDNIRITTIIPGFVQTNVSKNALGGTGKATGITDENIKNGLPVDECIKQIIQGFTDGVEEIVVAKEMELGLLQLKRENPNQVFRVAEQLAQQWKQS